jgi:hypothetical protein
MCHDSQWKWSAGLCKDGVAAARAFPPGDEPCADAMGLAKEADVINVSMPLVNGCAAAAVGSIRCANVCERALCASVPAAGDWPVDVDAGGAVVRQVRSARISESGVERRADTVRPALRGQLRAKTESAACGLAGGMCMRAVHGGGDGSEQHYDDVAVCAGHVRRE